MRYLGTTKIALPPTLTYTLIYLDALESLQRSPDALAGFIRRLSGKRREEGERKGTRGGNGMKRLGEGMRGGRRREGKGQKNGERGGNSAPLS